MSDSDPLTRPIAIFLALFLTSASHVSAIQEPRGATLQPVTVRLPEEFSRIAGVRELSDGRVLVGDAVDKRLVAVDFARLLVTQIGREGRGPGEYAQVTAPLALGTDSTLMADPANGRWILLRLDQVARIIPPDDPRIKNSRGTLRGADARGNLLIVGPPSIRGGDQVMGKYDSVAALLVSLASPSKDTVTHLRIAPMTVWTEVDNAGKVTRAGLRIPPFSVGEEPILLPDGWLAVARLDPYRVEWRAPSGRWVQGAPLPFTKQPVDARERQAYLDRRTTALGRAQPPPPPDAWPEWVPAFQPSPLLAVPDGTILILRTPTADHPGNRYDHISRTGRLIGWLELPASDRLVSIGGRGAYVVSTDPDGIQHLQRHPWP